MHIMESIEEHPYIAAGGVFVLGIVLIVILFSGGSKAAAPVVQAQSDTSSATQFAMAQLQSQTALGVASLGVQKDANDNAAAVQAAQLVAATTQNHDLQQYNTVVAAGLINRDTAIGTSTIQANYMSHASDNALTASLADTEAQRQVGLSTVEAQRQIGLSTVAAQQNVALSTVDAQRAIGLANISATQTVNLAQIAGAVTMNAQNNATAQITASDTLQAALAQISGQVTVSGNALAATRNTNATNQAIAFDNNSTQLHLGLDQDFRAWNQGQIKLDNNRTAIALAQFNH